MSKGVRVRGWARGEGGGGGQGGKREGGRLRERQWFDYVKCSDQGLHECCATTSKG
jgi:hypothetical protein